MRIWKRFSFVSFLLALIFTAGGYVVWKSCFAKFTARARLLVAAEQPKVFFETVESLHLDGADYKRYQLTQLALVKSLLALNAALQDQEVSKYLMIRKQVDPIAWLQANLEVKFLGDSELMEIALSGDDPDEVAGIVNAVKKAYIEEVVNADIKQRTSRHDKLKKLKQQYGDILKERRDTLRKLAEISDGDDGLTREQREKAELLRSHALWSERLELRLEQAEVATLLDRRKEVAAPATDAVRKEIAQLEDRFAVAMARQKVLDRELEEMNQSRSVRRELALPTLDLVKVKTDIAQMEENYRKVAVEVEALSVELSAPPRIRTIEDAVPPKTRG